MKITRTVRLHEYRVTRIDRDDNPYVSTEYYPDGNLTPRTLHNRYTSAVTEPVHVIKTENFKDVKVEIPWTVAEDYIISNKEEN